MVPTIEQGMNSLEEIIDDIDSVKVTVICLTYNQVSSIKRCLDTLINQETMFKYEIWVGDDCSTDGTTEIVREYSERYPEKIIPFIRESNMGSIRNYGDLCESVRSDYIAFCDGDDYWIDEQKLQKQFTFLEENLDYNGCFGKTQMIFEGADFFAKHYMQSEDGNYYYPFSHTRFVGIDSKHIKVENLIPTELFAHPSATMLRKNRELEELPDWFYESHIGDASFFILTIGDGQMMFIDELYSVYVKNDQGITSSYRNLDEVFINTRLAHIAMWSGLKEYFVENYDGYCQVAYENRIKQEVAHYLRVVLKFNEFDKLHELVEKYPEATKIALSTFMGFYWDSRRMTARYTWAGNKLIARNTNFMKKLRPFVHLYLIAQKLKNKITRALKNAARRSASFFGYWFNTLIPKKKNLWVFSGFRANNYMDNTKYLYEYVFAKHPEIQAVWLTRNKEVYEGLKCKNMPVELSRKRSGRKVLSKAAVAVTDHFRITDFSSVHGFNAKTKVVQLWHGVGIKAMGDKDNRQVINVSEKGVRYSDDILVKDGDSFLVCLCKRIKYVLTAPSRELFEKYFMFVCPGQERIDMIAQMWDIPESAWFMAGHPRNINLHSAKNVEGQLRILYAPTYRWSPRTEKQLVEFCLYHAELIQEKMEELNGIFTIRLHPHTWRSYGDIIEHKIQDFDRIEYDNEPDIYETLHNYSMIISDYSSIAYDLAMIDRPTIFLCFDYETFIEKEPGFNLDYMAVTPGPKVFTWEDALVEVEKYARNLQKDSNLRHQVCEYFFDSKVNNEDNSERIVEEIKRRLGF